MAVTAKFLADWTSFYDAVDKADVKIVSFQDGAHKAESALNRMVDNFSGRKVIQEATVMAEAVERAGGTSKLTATELENVSRVAGQAADKMKAMGVEVPASIQQLANAATNARVENDKMLDSIGLAGGRLGGLNDNAVKASAGVGGLTNTYKAFDGALQAVGINIGPQVKGIEDLANAAAGGAGKIGLVAGAGLALGTGLAAWGITRAVMEFLDLDKAVAKVWTTLLGYGDAAAEVAGAKQDVINRAIANGAREHITYAEAIKFNLKHQQELDDQYVVSGRRLSDAQREVRSLSEARREEIIRAKENGATEEQLIRVYGISAEGLKVLIDRHQLASRALEEHKRKSEELAEAKRRENEALEKSYQRLMSDVKNANQLAIMDAEAAAMADRKTKAAEGWIAAQVKATTASRDAAAAEAARVAQNQLDIDQQAAGLQRLIDGNKGVADAAKSSTDTAKTGFAGVAQQVTLTGEAIKEFINLMRYTAQANAILQGGSSLFTTQSQRERVAGLPSFAGGVENFQGGLAYVHKGEALVNMPAGTSVIPAGRVGAGGGAPSLSLSIVANTIISTREEITQMVRMGIKGFYEEQGIPLPAGVG